MADFAHWEILRATEWMDSKTDQLLARELVGVRVQAARILEEEIARRPVARSHRSSIPEPYLWGVIDRAKTRYAVERPAW